MPSALTCRFRISSSAIGLHLGRGRGALDGAAHGLWRGRARSGELDQLGESRPRECPGDSPLYPGPEELRRTGLVAVGLVRAENLALGGRVEALHRRDRALERNKRGEYKEGEFERVRDAQRSEYAAAMGRAYADFVARETRQRAVALANG